MRERVKRIRERGRQSETNGDIEGGRMINDEMEGRTETERGCGKERVRDQESSVDESGRGSGRDLT